MSPVAAGDMRPNGAGLGDARGRDRRLLVTGSALVENITGRHRSSETKLGHDSEVGQAQEVIRYIYELKYLRILESLKSRYPGRSSPSLDSNWPRLLVGDSPMRGECRVGA